MGEDVPIASMGGRDRLLVECRLADRGTWAFSPDFLTGQKADAVNSACKPVDVTRSAIPEHQEVDRAVPETLDSYRRLAWRSGA